MIASIRLKFYMLFSFQNLVSPVFIARYTVENAAYQGKVETTNSIQITSSVNLRRCMIACNLHDKCVSFFYNKLTSQCILHSTSFNYGITGTSEVGWKFFYARDATGRCPPPYLYYRYLDFCYKILENYRIAYLGMQSLCGSDGGKLAAIDSQEKYNYFRHILQNRIYPKVGLGVDRNAGTWVKLTDGQPLTYFNWAPGQPDIDVCMQWKGDDLAYDHPCGALSQRVFVCEI